MTSNEPDPLLIVGASARAAAYSALRADLDPSTVDQFGDLDLRSCCPAHRAVNYPFDLERITSKIDHCPWMYTGALENHPQMVDAISADRPLYGNPGSVLRDVRDPLKVVQSLREAGLPHLDVQSIVSDEHSGQWLRKPRDSCGGGRIVLADAVARGAEANDAFYYQRLAEGVPASAVYVADGDRALLLGVTRQLVGLAWAGGAGYQYGGSIGPLQLAIEAETLVQKIGDCLTARFGLRGLFGVDFVTANGSVWPIEVNPRYTASVEVIERVSSLLAVALHVAVFREQPLPRRVPNENKNSHFAGKVIVYARRHGLVSNGFTGLASRLNTESPWPTLADIPAAGTELRPGHPIASVLAGGRSVAIVERRLKELTGQVLDTVFGDRDG